jgi:hypothetical protein
MALSEYYEDITSDEADFIIDLYDCIDAMVAFNIPVTLVRLSHELNVSTSELSDYLPTIITILNKVEKDREIRQEPD